MVPNPNSKNINPKPTNNGSKPYLTLKPQTLNQKQWFQTLALKHKL